MAFATPRRRTSRRRVATALLLAGALTACGAGTPGPVASGPGDEPDPGVDRPGPGRLVIAGGSLDPDTDQVWSAVVEARDLGGPLCVLPTASGAPRGSMESAVARFAEEIGSLNVDGILITRDAPHLASDPATVDRLSRCSGFWFTGGDQSRIADVFRPGERRTPGYDAILQRYLDGAVVAGSSAGAAMMPDPMIAAGGSVEALRHGLRTGEDGDGVWVRNGMGFFAHGFIDQHFLARGRWGRLLTAAMDHVDVDVGFGIDENTALVVDGTEARVLGESGVLLVDAREATGGRGAGSYRNVRLALAGTGDRIDLTTLGVVGDPEKVPMASDGQVIAPHDLFERWELLRSLAALAGASADTLEVRGEEGYVAVIRKGPGFVAVSYGTPGVEGTPSGLSAGPFVVDVELPEGG